MIRGLNSANRIDAGTLASPDAGANPHEYLLVRVKFSAVDIGRCTTTGPDCGTNAHGVSSVQCDA